MLIRLEIRSALALELLVEDLDLVGDDEFLAGMTDGLVGEYKHRHAILIRQVEGADRGGSNVSCTDDGVSAMIS